jgi:hypothetical protein
VAWVGLRQLQNYFGHSGPLYQIQWSPFAPGLFLSASADWTVKLWAEDNPAALITFQVGAAPITDNTLLTVANPQWSGEDALLMRMNCQGQCEQSLNLGREARRSLSPKLSSHRG